MNYATKIKEDRGWWIIICILTIIPVTAALHHLVFYRPTCMLNPFGSDYNMSTIIKWISRDPSLAWAIVIMIVSYHIGNYLYWHRIIIAPIFISLLPLSLWIWDIPFTGRYICSNYHDDRVMLMHNLPLRTKYVYIIGIFVYIILLSLLVKKVRKNLSQK